MNKTNLKILLIILLVVAVVDIIYHGGQVSNDYFYQFDIEVPKEQDNNIKISPETPHATKKGTWKKTADNIDELIINNRYGSIDITATDGDEVVIDYNIRVYANNQKTADQILSKLDLYMSEEGRSLKNKIKGLNVDKDEKTEPFRLVVNYTIKAPKRLRINLDNNFGDLSAEGFNAPFIIKNAFGPTQVRSMNASGKIETRYGTLFVSEIENDLEVDVRFNRFTTITDINGNLKFNPSYSPAEIENVMGDFEGRVRFSNLNLERIKGNLNLDADYSEIDGRNIDGDVVVESSFGDVNLSYLKQNVNVESRFSGISLVILEQDLKHTVDISGEAISFPVQKYGLKKEKEGLDTYTLKGTIPPGNYSLHLKAHNGIIQIRVP